jgi:OmpA-OmpF porin, OOP family
MKTLSKLLLLAGVFLFSITLNAQKIDVKGKLKNAINNRANNHVDNAIDKGLDAVENGVKDAVTEKDSTSNENQEAQNQSENQNENGEASEETKPQAKEKPEKVAIQSFTKYDFVPGDKVLFYEDFSQDAIGDFPALWNTNGSGEVKTVNIASGNWLNMNSEGSVYLPLPEIKFPENYICEFDIIATNREADQSFGCEIAFFHAEGEDFDISALFPGDNGTRIWMSNEEWVVSSYQQDKDIKEGRSTTSPVKIDEINHVIIWVQKTRARIYFNGQKAVDLPMIVFQPVNYNHMLFSLWGGLSSPYLSNIRITTAGADTRSKLLTEGKLISYGIYFDINKDVVKPESYGAMNDIAKILKENPDVRIKIVGYTDSDGADAANLDLSKRRAASVKNELVKSFGIDASRLESDGNGEGNPVASNDTPSNKALNRRVEFIKL